MEVMIRDATTEDVPAILSIVNHAILHTTAIYDYAPRSLEMQREWFEKKVADHMPVLVAEYENRVIGFGSYGIFRPKEAYKFCIEHSIYVAEDFRGKGVGKKLMPVLIDRATVQGFHSMIAVIDASNAGSIAFHEKFGFKEAGRFREVGYKFDRWLDLVFMQKILKSGI